MNLKYQQKNLMIKIRDILENSNEVKTYNKILKNEYNN